MMFDWKSIQQGSIPYLIPGGCHRGVNDKYKSVTNPLLDQGGSVGGEISMLASIPMLKSNGSIMVRYNDELPKGGAGRLCDHPRLKLGARVKSIK